MWPIRASLAVLLRRSKKSYVPISTVILKWGKMALKSSLVELIYPEHIHQLLVPQSRLPCVTSTKTIDIEIHKLEKLPAAEASS